jgi:hypothetical protein
MLTMNSPKIEIKKMWGIIAVGSDSTLELRAIAPKGLPGNKLVKILHFCCSDYSSVEDCKNAFEAAALSINAEGYNVYTLMNPLRPEFICGGAAKDVDIRQRDLLLIDIDRSGNTSCPANQAELDLAKALAEQIRSYLRDRSWPEPVSMMSGNGYHLYYILGAIPNDKNSEALICTFLKSLSAKFNTNIVSVDTTVYNASRITKVPGTIMRKGDESIDRPYRMALVLP